MTVSARCPVCDRLVPISPTGERWDLRWSSQWWLVDMHSDGKGKVCEGSGKRV